MHQYVTKTGFNHTCLGKSLWMKWQQKIQNLDDVRIQLNSQLSLYSFLWLYLSYDQNQDKTQYCFSMYVNVLDPEPLMEAIN